MERRIARYRPKNAPPAWERLAAEVRVTVARAAPTTTYRARDLLTALTRLALFADREGCPPDARRWLDAAMVERFAALGCPDIRPASRSNYRARLTAIRTAVYGPDLPGGRPVPLSGSDPSRPLTGTQKADLWAWAGGQPTGELRQGLRLLLALSLGCGLDSPEVIPARGPDVRVLSDGACVLAVRGRRARLIVCARPYEHTLAAAAQRAQTSYLFRPACFSRGSNTVTDLIYRATPDARVPRLVLGRCRATWLVERMDIPLPLPVLLAAAGLDSLHALSRFLPYLQGTSAEQAHTTLREMP
ncbi:hypothetical protein AF335_05015 [Streptomyces eurocidicus]|uniref:Tyr recombinase domain-containing protein n=1 Tax=Streptomyces eurocidicus TaxID=66423 RepID=A0A2N8P140_STREU|nr:hypothetical protein [Streptomyces eurocidicus]MBB5122742.1 hypothetical protein [Streptomyces eurocidicus]MBF6055211.1 hypothetical protein [Streptomyces eurocidicus]PNE34729.1 hypothetical protein AF335_05015 [Streptomyces eurocidicus]